MVVLIQHYFPVQDKKSWLIVSSGLLFPEPFRFCSILASLKTDNCDANIFVQHFFHEQQKDNA
jgi:hypothetical protein